eukprot:CAMPEP_0119082742 /NCGR_PEP_ID=MMETSP1178-20130426/122724_1 /TAXON_ID=33656 /ORGANISM="unid sp, Strain CCMP2000" /LENGTH=225 /DNA_ID=CAMNT_0007065541 /DNA_START=44 /DNA_END=721 /DNA_ORIENTATION=+
MAASVGTLIYFNFRGRGEPARLVAAYTGLELTQEIFTMREWGQYKQRMPKGQVPVLSLPDGTLMPEMNDICKHLAQLPSPAGRQLVVDDRQDSMIRTVNGALMDRVAHITNMYPTAHAVAESDSVREQATLFLQQFSALLGAESFFGGAVPGYGELALWLLVEDCLLLVPDLLDHLDESFKQWYARIADLPCLAEFFASRPQVGEGIYGMPGSILHSGVPVLRSA